jgi:Leucine-rich repeat (LRR) protein
MPDLSELQFQEIHLEKNDIHTIFQEYIPRICKQLYLDKNRIHSDSLPFAWPEEIRLISLAQNYLFDTDGVSWPASLEELILDKNPLQIWPVMLPDTMTNLSMNQTDIRTVEPLPHSLRRFSAASSRITQLPTSLPDMLVFLDLHNNLLRNSRLPSDWGQHLKVLDLERNNLTKIPSNLPDTIEILRLSCNKITEVPSSLPSKLQVLLLNHNCLRKVHYENRRKPIKILSLNDNQLTESIRDVDVNYAALVWEEENWAQAKHEKATNKIRRAWRQYRFRQCLRTLVKTRKIRGELLEVSMHPCRAGRFEDISQEWGGWGC